jgi:hypothetical protein
LKRPAFQFYPADWRKDSALQSCGIAARGLWHEMICIMHECDPYGHLAVNGQAMTTAQLSRLVGESERCVKAWLAELKAAGVYSETETGVIYSRRMVADERLREVRAASGRLGGNPNLLNQKDKQKVNHTSNQSDKQSPTPSSSSSSSSSKERVPRKRAPATDCPTEFEVTDPMADWAEAQGLPADRIMPETEKFLSHHKSKGNAFADWDQAWRNWIRKACEFSGYKPPPPRAVPPTIADANAQAEAA